MKTLVCRDRDIRYDGTQLAGHWIYRNFDLLDDAMVAFAGEAEVRLEHMVDLEDVKGKAPIYSPRMLHFLGEWFIDSLEVGILYQHFFMAVVYETLWESGMRSLRRRGNDIYFEDRKLSVSIATRTSLSCLVHAAVNIRTEGTPVPTAGLQELGLEPFAFAEKVLQRFREDAEIWRKARVKVLPR